jgi:hypothetical protein
MTRTINQIKTPEEFIELLTSVCDITHITRDSEKYFKVIARTVDEETFQPTLILAKIEHDKPESEWATYSVRMEVALDDKAMLPDQEI